MSVFVHVCVCARMCVCVFQNTIVLCIVVICMSSRWWGGGGGGGYC